MSQPPDLGAVCDEHVASEFEAKDIDATMATMVDEPYVWNVPTLEGGSGGKGVRDWYVLRFIGHVPPDVEIEPISRTVSDDHVIDEIVFSFTHDEEIPFMLPGVAPTGRRVRVPLVVVMGFEGTRITHEHIHWDQASVLVQVGLLDPSELPVSGVEQADRLLELARGA